jgi:hypothetical protein
MASSPLPLFFARVFAAEEPNGPELSLEEEKRGRLGARRFEWVG